MSCTSTADSIRIAFGEEEQERVLRAVVAVPEPLLHRAERRLHLPDLLGRQLRAVVAQVAEHLLAVLAQEALALVEEMVAQTPEQIGEDLRVVDLPLGVI